MVQINIPGALRTGVGIIYSFSFLLGICMGQQQGQQLEVQRLGQLNIYPEWMTLSGFSSGGSFAQQMQISYSSLFSGIAVFSHTYYRCGPPTGVQADYDRVCTTLGNVSNSELYDTNLVLQDIQNYYDQDLIDNPINIRNKRLYVFAGTRNALFTVDMSLRIMQVYEPLIQNTEAVKSRVMEADLLLPTVDFGLPCQESAGTSNFFLGSCGISGAYEALQFLLGDIVKKPPPPRNERIRVQPLQAFDQTEFFYGFDGRHDMDDVGYIYIPTKCNYLKCLFHFYFHGCLTGREFNGTSHIENSGYLEVAELSNIIMIFPQAISSPENDIGCWDTYGFTSQFYATKRGHQVTVVRNIMARLLGEDESRGSEEPTQILEGTSSRFETAPLDSGLIPDFYGPPNTNYGPPNNNYGPPSRNNNDQGTSTFTPIHAVFNSITPSTGYGYPGPSQSPIPTTPPIKHAIRPQIHGYGAPGDVSNSIGGSQELSVINEPLTVVTQLRSTSYFPPRRQIIDQRYPVYPSRRYQITIGSDGSLRSVPAPA